VFGVGVHLRRGLAHGVQRGEVEDEGPDIGARDGGFERVFREFEPSRSIYAFHHI
jgi:hypothetical protein